MFELYIAQNIYFQPPVCSIIYISLTSKEKNVVQRDNVFHSDFFLLGKTPSVIRNFCHYYNNILKEKSFTTQELKWYVQKFRFNN